MPATIAQPKSSTIQIRLPDDAKKQISKRAVELGLSISEYARTTLLINSGALNAEIKRFWREIEKTEAEYRAGKYQPTSADELFEIARKARNEN